MKMTYAAPTLVKSGSVLVETKGPISAPGDADNGQLPVAVGSVGFHL